MSVEFEKNIYGLSEGVFKACQFLGLKFPPAIPATFADPQKPMPSDYFGDNFELDSTMTEKLRSERGLSKAKFAEAYQHFSKTFSSQKTLKRSKTDVNVLFCDFLIFTEKQTGAVIKDYFNFEFYTKSFAVRNTFLTKRHYFLRRIICNDNSAQILLKDKSKTNTVFNEFTHRDWLNACTCTFEEFKNFATKHPRFFSKPVTGIQGKSAKIIKITPNQNLEDLFATLKEQNNILEEVIVQHEEIAAFCPDTVNTIRVATLLDIHNVVHIMTASGRFGRVGKYVDNYSNGGFSVVIDPKTGVITSDAISLAHEQVKKHPDTGKTFKGFQYPCWDKVRVAVTKMAKLIPQLRHIGWDITVNTKSEAVIVEANENPAVGVQQAPDSVGRLHLYEPLLEEMKTYNEQQMKALGWRVNNIRDFDEAYESDLSRSVSALKFAMEKLIPDCKSLIDLGCRKTQYIQSLCPKNIACYSVDCKKHGDGVIVSDFNNGEFPDISADACLCAVTAEYVEPLPQFLANMCNAVGKQILMVCRPVDKESNGLYRWAHPFLTDFTEEFLIETMRQYNFQLSSQSFVPKSKSVILYDFRKISSST